MRDPDLDGFITSSCYRRVEVTVACVDGHRWQTQAHLEYGAISLVDDDQVCPECGADRATMDRWE